MDSSSRRFHTRLRHQRGQALIYGILILLAGISALFFMFNTGQLVGEKTKLVNTADAVAYSAGVMHARALNFDAYTNRAMMANEVMIAQMVSISSWIKYAEGHVNDIPPMNCYQIIYSVPVWLGLDSYVPLCAALSYPPGAAAVRIASQAVSVTGPIVMAASEAAKLHLQLSQAAMFAALGPARAQLMQEVADANYADDGKVQVDQFALTDNFFQFEGEPFIKRYTGDQRTRFREAELTAARRDPFVPERAWSDNSPWPCPVAPRGNIDRTGGTTLIGFDEWRADDQASLKVESFSLRRMRCRTQTVYPLGNGGQVANPNESSWRYSGVPSFFELSSKALAYGPEQSDAARREPRLRFAVRLTRSNKDARTSMGRSAVKPQGHMDLYQGAEAGDVMAAVATSEVFFDRPTARDDGMQELASLFNPYWQARLVGNSSAVVAAATARQTGDTK